VPARQTRGDTLGFGGSVVKADRAREVIARTLAFTEAVRQRIDQRDEVRDVALACAVPEAEHKVYALEQIGSTMSMPMGTPHVLVSPQPPLRSRRADLPWVIDALQAELHRAFEVERNAAATRDEELVAWAAGHSGAR
jgi:hypothetical protein